MDSSTWITKITLTVRWIELGLKINPDGEMDSTWTKEISMTVI